MNAKVSIILPSYNVAAYIEKCLDSVVEQTLSDIEIICVDAGSEDGTLEIINRFASEDSRIKIIHSDKKSYGYQMNCGIRSATGEYIGIVETDDYIAEDMYEKLYVCAHDNILDCVKAGGSFFVYEEDSAGYKIVPFWLFAEKDRIYEGTICPTDYPEIIGIDGNLWRGIYRRDLFNKHDFFNETKGAAYQDIGFSIMAFSRIKHMRYIPDSFYFYRVGREGASSSKPDSIRFLYQEFSWLKNEIGILKEFPLVKKGFYLRMATTFLGEYEKVLNHAAYDRNSVYLADYYEFLVDELNNARNKGYISEQDFSGELWEKLWKIIDNNDSYVDLAKKSHEIEVDRESKLIEACTSRKVVIFGCGTYGDRVLGLIGDTSEVDVFCDNNDKLWGAQHRGYSVMDPKTAAQLYGDDVWVVANKLHSDEILRQIRDYDVERIYVWR